MLFCLYLQNVLPEFFSTPLLLLLLPFPPSPQAVSSLPCTHNSGKELECCSTGANGLLMPGQEADLKRTVDESCRIQRSYGHYFDLSLVNDNLERTFQQLQEAMEKLRSEPQWVPVSWVY